DVNVRNYIYAARETICYEKPDIVVHPFPGGQYKYDFIKLCKEWGIEVIVRRGEAGMGREEFEKLDKNRRSIILGNWDYSPYVDLELNWGQEFVDIIVEQGYMPPRKLKVCGAFAFDPYFPLNHKNLRDDQQRTVLFATCFFLTPLYLVGHSSFLSLSSSPLLSFPLLFSLPSLSKVVCFLLVHKSIFL
ncbi:MAG: hypothetical protein IIB83_02840, partial [Bacteroidetes bacterium]|nr:hypothetical protein [Bacteroidota bacterium]